MSWRRSAVARARETPAARHEGGRDRRATRAWQVLELPKAQGQQIYQALIGWVL